MAAHLDALGIVSVRHRRIATEGTYPGGLIRMGFSLDPAIISDGAGQFAILRHALSRVHAERLVHKLIPLNGRQRADQARVRGEIWDLYADLKAYRRNPDPALRPALEARFDAIFTQRTSYTEVPAFNTHKVFDSLMVFRKSRCKRLATRGSP
ncbi:hypothetical protein [Thiocapsa sp.]|uniref:hypothetical protein n=1 Tax=Thiocapsa sp. TaxID=2024551 RepID=UPI0035934519